MTLVYNNFPALPGENLPPFKIFMGNCLHFNDHRVERAKQNLSLYEIDRANKFIPKITAASYILSHFFLRKILAEKTKTSLEKLEIVFDTEKKPYGIPHCLDFNISHSQNLFAIAVADHASSIVGVDIEAINYRIDFVDIVHQYFHDTEKAFIFEASNNRDSSVSRFFQVWTRKEAFLKMLGTGLINNLDVLDMASPECSIDLPIISPDTPNLDNIFIRTSTNSEYALSLATTENRLLEIQCIGADML
jgi:4'-phosphopantetheinyl transferase